MQNKSSLKDIRISLAIGALLHDIGKVIWRAQGETILSNLKQIGKEKDYKAEFTYTHAYLTDWFLEKENLKFDLVIASSSYHHSPQNASDKISAKIYQLADQYSSKERSERKKEFKDNFLRPVFQNISLSKNDKDVLKDEYFYRLKPLIIEETKNLEETKEVIFPVRKEEAFKFDETQEYINLWNEFQNEFSQINRIKNSKEKFLTNLYYLLYKYFWCVPASIYDPKRREFHYPDISLFDHLRTSAILSTSLYTNYNLNILKSNLNTSNEKLAEQLKLVLVKGDLSGIQSFLYDIANIEGVTKRLRGRSVFLSLLPDLTARYILHTLEYPFINILFAGGGHFELIIGYEENIQNKLLEIQNKIEETLIEEFGGKIGLVLVIHEFTLDKISDYSQLTKKVYKELDKAKKRKFISLIESKKIEEFINKDYKTETTHKICPSCNWRIIEESRNICDWCEIFEKVGGKIPKSKYLIFSLNKLSLPGFYLEDIGGIYFSEELDIKERDKLEILCLNSTDFISKNADGFKFLAQTVPVKDKEVKSFEEIVEDAEGDKKLSFARADVDNLGFIFMKGLGKNKSISRIATLSRTLDLFFSGYLNEFIQKNEKYKNKIYTVYAGGDDLFIVGAWDIIFSVLKDIRKEFEKYTCKNPVFHLSCGVFTSHSKYPLRLAGEEAEKAEGRAKNQKPAIDVLEETLKWEIFERAINSADNVIKEIEGQKIGRTNFYRIYLLLREYIKWDKKGDEKKYRFYPFFYYYLLRNVKDKEIQKLLSEYFLKIEEDYKVRDDALFRAKYVIMRTREI